MIVNETVEVHKSNHSQMFFKIGVLWPATLLKRDFNTCVFPVNIAKYLRIAFLYRITPVAVFCVQRSIEDIPRNNCFKN